MYIDIKTRGVLIICDCICQCLCDMVGNFISVSCEHLEGLSVGSLDKSALISKCYCFGEINSVLKLFDYSID